MKASNKAGGIKSLLLAHCEKAIALVVVLGGVYLAYMSLGVVGEQRKAEALNSAVQQTRTAYQSARWDNPSDVPPENKLIAYDPGSGAIERIDTQVYSVSSHGWGRPVVPPTVDRIDPKLLPALGVEGTAFTGLGAFVNDDIRGLRLEAMRQEREEEARRQREREERDPLGGEGGGRGGEGGGRGGFGGFAGSTNQRGQKGSRPAPRVVDRGFVPQGDELIKTVSCAVVLAKAPARDQYEAYKSELSEARGYDPLRDVPNYLGYMVERAEVRDSQQLEWKSVPLTDGMGRYSKPVVSERTLEGAIREWAGGGEPIVDQRYEHPVLTMPLPPLVGLDLGHNAVHSEAPLQAETDKLEQEKLDEDLPDDSAEGESGQDDFFSSSVSEFDTRLGRSRATGGEFGARRSAPRGRPGMMGDGGEGRGFGEGGGESEGGGRSGFGRSRSRSGSAGLRGAASFDPEIPFTMLRFFDFTVVPGRQYRYRVRLVLADVNQAPGVEKRFLDREVVERIEKATRKPYRLSEWSEPGSIISVPLAGDAFIASGKPAGKGAYSEGSVEMLVQSYSINEEGRAVKAGVIESFRRGSVMNLTEDAEVLSDDRRWIEEIDDFPFRTGITLCDFIGGGELARGIDEPTQALLMDASGRLFVRQQGRDAKTVEQHRATFEQEVGGNQGGFPGGGQRGEGFDF